MKKIKKILATILLAISVCVGTAFGFAGCKKQENFNPSNVAVVNFQEYFYHEDGKPKLVQLEGDATAWVAGVSHGEAVISIFNDITGMNLEPTDSYNYEYVSSDEQVTISIIGNLTCNDEAVFAIMAVTIPDYPEVKEIHLVNPDYFNGVNSGTVITVIL